LASVLQQLQLDTPHSCFSAQKGFADKVPRLRSIGGIIRVSLQSPENEHPLLLLLKVFALAGAAAVVQ
jgi:hypothetical protein